MSAYRMPATLPAPDTEVPQEKKLPGLPGLSATWPTYGR